MEIALTPLLRKELPKLGWLASLDRASGNLLVYHGSSVEYHDGWIVEGVWDDDFIRGDFHRTGNFFGSGIRLDEGSIFFVPSKALVDRLVYCNWRDCLLVSNSLLILLSYTGARLDVHHDYARESFTILKGIHKYDKDITVQHPEIQHFHQAFYHNLTVNDAGDLSVEEHCRSVKISTYSDYLQLIENTLRELQKNYESSARTHPITPLSTVSSGYDSTAVTSLVSEFGVKLCFTSRKSNSILPECLHPKASIDDGSPIARRLGLEVEDLDQLQIEDDELYFLAASVAGPEMTFYKMARYISEHCQVALVFTGYHGDVLWHMKRKPAESGKDIIRGDTSGFNLSEVRLKFGFINAALPFLFAHSINDIVRISNSDEMKEWRLNNNYDRPIARRLVEEKGIPRNLFGFRKKGVTKYYNYPLNSELREEFFAFIKENFGYSKLWIYFYSYMTKYPVLIIMGILYVIGLGTLIDKNRRPGLRFSRLMYIWAANRLADTFSRKLDWRADEGKQNKGIDLTDFH